MLENIRAFSTVLRSFAFIVLPREEDCSLPYSVTFSPRPMSTPLLVGSILLLSEIFFNAAGTLFAVVFFSPSSYPNFPLAIVSRTTLLIFSPMILDPNHLKI